MFLVVYCVALVVVPLLIFCISAIRRFKTERELEAEMCIDNIKRKTIEMPEDVFEEFLYFEPALEQINKRAFGTRWYRACICACRIGYTLGKNGMIEHDDPFYKYLREERVNRGKRAAGNE